MSEIRVNSRYAKSLLELSIEKEILEDIYKDIKQFAKISDTNRDFVLLLKNPIINSGKKLAILKQLFEGKVHEVTMQFFTIITRKNREDHLPGIAASFVDQYNKYKNIEKAMVTTTFPLGEQNRAEVRQLIKKISGKDVELKEKVDPSIIGGFVLQIGDRRIDSSISSKLKELKYQFSYNPYVKEF